MSKQSRQFLGHCERAEGERSNLKKGLLRRPCGPPRNDARGIFITFEGPEGCGKSTQAKLLYDFLKRKGYDCVFTREPGGTQVGDFVRHILLDSKQIAISDLAEVFLFEAARAQIVGQIILPSLKEGKIIICDRFYDATAAYQGYGGKVSLKTINVLNNIATGGLRPDLTLLLDVDTITGLKRAKKKGIDRMEEKAITYHKRVRAGYLKLAKKEPERIKIVKVKKYKFETQEKIRKLTIETICHSRPVLSFPRKRESMHGVIPAYAGISGNP